MQNLEAEKQKGEEVVIADKNLDLDLGTTEYVLITLWFIFTAGVFGLLYKITKEADEDCEEQMRL